jgi:hypothetical protein
VEDSIDRALLHATYSTVLYVSASHGDAWRVKGSVVRTVLQQYAESGVGLILSVRTTLLETTVWQQWGRYQVERALPLGGGRLAQYVRGVAREDVCRYNLKHTLLYL